MSDNGFQRSSFCNFGNCPEIKILPDGSVLFRDSQLPEVALVFNRREWSEFIAGVKNGEFDLPPESEQEQQP